MDGRVLQFIPDSFILQFLQLSEPANFCRQDLTFFSFLHVGTCRNEKKVSSYRHKLAVSETYWYSPGILQKVRNETVRNKLEQEETIIVRIQNLVRPRREDGR